MDGRIFRLLHMIMYIIVSLMFFGTFIFSSCMFALLIPHSIFFLIGAVGSGIGVVLRFYNFNKDHIPYLIDMENDKNNKNK